MVYHGNKEKLTELRDQINQYRQSKNSPPLVLIKAYHMIINHKYIPNYIKYRGQM